MEVSGILTLENVLECILNLQILDERDREQIETSLTKQRGKKHDFQELCFARP
jgi:Mg2+/Co2+ transporter CorC